jgi:hypothetical protein
MVQPYNINIPNVGTEMLSGFQTGQEMVVRRQAQERQAAMQKAMADLAEKKNKTVEDYQQVMTEFPEMSKQVEQSLSMFNEQQQQNKINQLMNVYAPLKSGNTDLAKSNLDELITAYRNSGNDIEAKSMDTLKQNIELDPKGAETSSELFLFKALGPEAFQKYLLQEQKTEAGLKGRFQPATEKGPDGTIWAMNDKGEVTVKDITGNVLEGEEAKKAWLKSKEYGVKIAEDTNYSRESGKLSAQKGTKAEIQKEVTGAQKEAESQEARIQDIIDKGYSAAETTPILRRSLELMKEVKTGGFAGVKLKAKQYLGVQGADEAELSTNLARAAIAKLRQNLGAQFTERENKMLQRIEAGIGKSTQGNIRILEQSLTVANNSAKRAIRRARARGDKETVDEIEALMNESLAPPAETPPAETQQITATNPETGQKIVFKNGQWFDFKTNRPVQ